jgi:hypothetical protein
LEAARAARRVQPKDAVEIQLRAGRYQLDSTITIAPADSNLTIAAYQNERPVLSGGRRITEWRKVSDAPARWQAKVSEENWYFRSLFINGQRKQRARTPNEGFYRILGPSSQDKPIRLKFKPGDIKKEWAGRGDVEVIALLAWSNIRMFIRDVDEANSVATLSEIRAPPTKRTMPAIILRMLPTDWTHRANGIWIKPLTSSRTSLNPGRI